MKLLNYALMSVVSQMNSIKIRGKKEDVVLIKNKKMVMIGAKIYLTINHALLIGNANQVDV